MSAKKPSVRDKRLRWKFDDGSTDTLPLVDHEAQLQAQYHAMATSDEPSLRIAGRKLLQSAAEQAAAAQMAQLQRANASKADRTRSEIRERIQNAMGPHKADGTVFKVFMQAWERDAIDGLRLKKVSDTEYFVDDENGDCCGAYKWGTLQKLYSACR